jgi:hypothetical protein
MCALTAVVGFDLQTFLRQVWRSSKDVARHESMKKEVAICYFVHISFSVRHGHTEHTGNVPKKNNVQKDDGAS